jgi:GNAT superfamily N-acetyltransferase
MDLVPLTPELLTARAAELSALVRDAVEGGASIGFTLPLTEAEVAGFWRGVGEQLAAGAKVAFLALDGADRVVGSAQLALEMRSNGRHRAEVQKVLVLRRARGAGVGAALMAALEDAARAHGRTLLFLDTSVGAAGAEAFYGRLGWTKCGGIPDYAANPDGTLAANAIYYKRLAASVG